MLVPLRGKLFEERHAEKRPVAVGDRVRVTIAGGGAIEEVLPRTSKLARRSAGHDGREQILAANVTLVAIVAALQDPPFLPAIVDRILASCARQELEAMLVLTKLDRDTRGEAARWGGLYRALGYRVLVTSIEPGHETTEALDELRVLLHGNITVMTGLSGVGKSSLLNHLLPGLGLRIGTMNRIRQGKHTTAFSQLVPLPGGGHVLDTPGIRSFGLWGVAPQELTFWFREFVVPARDCAYRDCTHVVERDCGVQAAVAAGTVDPSRYDSYRGLFAELADIDDHEER